jgi:hypothetical protein
VLAEGVKGPFTRINFPGRAPRTLVLGINDRGQNVGLYENPNTTPDRQQSSMRMPGMVPGH